MSCYKKSEKTKLLSFLSFAALVTALVAFIGCEKVEEPVYSNPIDPLNKDFILPQATITNSIDQGAVLEVSTVTFSWYGVIPNGSFSYMLKGYDDTYSAWSSRVSTITYDYLDEGNYTFYVKERYNEEIVQETPDSLAFTIDAVTDCALLLRKWKINALSGESFSIYLDVENVSGLKGLTTVIDFPSDSCTLQSIEQVNDGLEGPDGMLFVATLPEDANNSGNIEINAIGLGNATGFTGNATVCKLNFESDSDSEYNIHINSSGTELRDIDNNTIVLEMVRGTVVN